MTAGRAASVRRRLSATRSEEQSRHLRERRVLKETVVDCGSAVVAVAGAIAVVQNGLPAVEGAVLACGFLALCAAYSWRSFKRTRSNLVPYVLGLAALQQTGRLRLYAILERVAAFVRLTVIFVLATALLTELGIVTAVGLHATSVTAGQAASFYVWNSLNAIPGLDIPTTLNWQITHPLTDIASRTLLLAYKALVLLPLLGFLYLLVLKLWDEAPWMHRRDGDAGNTPAAGP
jgi:hypothetical protein